MGLSSADEFGGTSNLNDYVSVYTGMSSFVNPYFG